MAKSSVQGRKSPWEPVIGLAVYRNVANQMGIITAILPPRVYRYPNHPDFEVPVVEVTWKRGRKTIEEVTSLGDANAAIAALQAAIDEFVRERDALGGIQP